MENTAVNAKGEDTVAVVTTADAAVIATDVANPMAVSDEIVAPIELETEPETDEINNSSISNCSDCPQYISSGSDCPQHISSDSESAQFISSDSDSPQYISSDSDAVIYISSDEENTVVNEQRRGVIHDENFPDCESSSQQKAEGGDGDAPYDEEIRDPAASAEPMVPVPVDGNTIDPQCIPRRGRFCEHDDRMIYIITTSSEGSESDYEYEEDSEDESSVSDRRRRRCHRRIRIRDTGIKKQKIQ